MGVQGLWQVLEPVGKPVALETLENKVLGVDVSLWLHQAVKGMRDGQGQPVSNAHLMVLLQRVCKLLFYRIKPVFVFDGGVPQLKRQTLAARHQRQATALEEAQRQRMRRVLIAHAQRRLQKIQGTPQSPKKVLQRSPKKSPRKGPTPQADIFELPPLPAPLDTLESDDEEVEDASAAHIDVPDTVDVESEDFSMLPADIRHNILVSLHDRHRYGHRRSDLPKDSESFSGYQMSRLLKKRSIQQKLEEARRDLSHFRSQQWIAREEQQADIYRVASETNAHQILLRKGVSSSDADDNPSSCQVATADVSAETEHNDTVQPQRSWTLLRKDRPRTEAQGSASSQPGTSGGAGVCSTHKISLSGEPAGVTDSADSTPPFDECNASSWCAESVGVPEISPKSPELLRLLGMPYLVSPEEAEAQCAQLEQLGLTQGTVTDDSDVWLFGGTSVYKHFFQREKFVEHFSYNDILRHFGLDRQKMIAFALLSGSDYTTGIYGVGPVNAMEIISEFQATDAIGTLCAFRDWLEKAKLEQVSPGNRTRSHLLRFELTPGFPSSVVVDAYLNPATDSSREIFTWGIPDLDGLRTFGLQKLGWTQEKMDSLLLPVLKRLQEKQSQSRIDSYFSVETTKREQLFPSKRLRRATKKVAQKSAKRREIPLQEPALSEESD
ncbi:DNA excision repair protein ERCC-5 homolog [Ornithodoros turicata]|uniref:DNA excision repair protein ERCC-5 homolog n=1 Tax=Ornithodoros turicata TaxID=34597 RepID=UPI003139706C